MIRADLVDFMKREFGEEGIQKLNDILDNNGINHNLDGTDKHELRMLAKDIRNSLPIVSLAKRNLLYAEILKVLKVQVLDTSTDKYTDETVKETVEQEHKKIEHYVKDIDKSLSKYEAIFNLFWLRAGEAEMSGITHEEIIRTTNKALLGIKKDLEKNREEIMVEYDLLEKNKARMSRGFSFRAGNFIEKKIQEKNDIDLKNKKLLKEVVEKLWNKVDETYFSFKKIFMESMDKEILMKKEGKDDSELIIQTQQKMKNIWQDLENSYQQFVADMDVVKQKIGENLRELS